MAGLAYQVTGKERILQAEPETDSPAECRLQKNFSSISFLFRHSAGKWMKHY